jgi:putative ABC transport system substrate-binding protein
MPTARRVLWVSSADSRYFPTVAGGRFDLAAALEASAKNLGFEPQFRFIRAAHAVDDIDAAFSDITAWRAQAVVVGAGQYPETRQRIAELSLRHRLPSAFGTREDFDAGGLLFYGRGKAEDAYTLRRLVEYVDQVLRGKAPADLPVERPNRYELAINLTTAKALGLTIPPSILLRADQVIE